MTQKSRPRKTRKEWIHDGVVHRTLIFKKGCIIANLLYTPWRVTENLNKLF